MKDKETAKAAKQAEEEKKTCTEPEDEAAAEQPDGSEAAQKELEALRKELAEEKDRYLRMAAEYDNYRRRSAKEREGAYGDAYADALMEIIPVIDNLERAAGFSEGQEQPDAKQLSDGVALILTQFKEVLKKLGIEEFGAAGDAFDPQIHNAIMHDENEELPENTISDVFQKGYRRGEKIIRCAMVKVVN